jgi:sugar O-acyltransferase (sialic acid O-acetyltransferase NeuD family)
MKPLLLVGGGGHCRSCIDVVEQEGRYRVAGVVERPGGSRTPVLGYPVLGDDEGLPELLNLFPTALVAVGQIRTAKLRKQLFSSLQESGAELATVVSPRACVSRHAVVGEGTIVMHGAIVNAAVSIGANCILNSLALVEHDTVVESHCHIATGVTVNGGVFIGSGSFVGSGAVIYEGVRVGADCVIAAGSVVKGDLSTGTRLRRNP